MEWRKASLRNRLHKEQMEESDCASTLNGGHCPRVGDWGVIGVVIYFLTLKGVVYESLNMAA